LTTFSRERVAQREAEALHWWQLHQEGYRRFRADPTDPQMDFLRDEIEVMRLNTDWPLMRQRCAERIARDDAVRRSLVRRTGT
jgi:hypothetical protein